jgi:hypothetical protein
MDIVSDMLSPERPLKPSKPTNSDWGGDRPEGAQCGHNDRANGHQFWMKKRDIDSIDIVPNKAPNEGAHMCKFIVVFE